jgi:hypothetical protein
MKAKIFTDIRGTICDSCDYLVDNYQEVPWGEDIAKVCIDCYLAVMEER